MSSSSSHFLNATHVARLREARFFSDLIKENAAVYAVGGSVRDFFLGRDSKDIDLVVCHIEINKLISLLKKTGKTNLVGKSFGVIKYHPAEIEDLEIDIALPRTERSTGIGHKDFKVEYNENLPVQDDLMRRDFTLNAMAIDLNSGELIDPSLGKSDLDKNELRIVFENSFEEDPLRLLRAVQFCARFGFSLEKNTKQKLSEQAQLIETVSPERIVEEVKKLFLAPKPSLGFDLMRDTGLLPFVFPDVQEMIGVTQPNKNNEDVYTHTMKVLDAARGAEELDKPGDLDIMFSALFHDAGKPKTRRESGEKQRVTFFNHQHVSTGIAWRWMKDMKARSAGVDAKKVCHLVKHHMFETKPFEDNDKALRRFINKVGKEHILDLIDLRLADKKGGKFPKKVYGILKLRERIIEEINRKAPFTTKDLAITGHDLIELGFKAGPVLGDIQRFLLDKVLDDPDLNQKDTLTALVQENRTQFENN